MLILYITVPILLTAIRLKTYKSNESSNTFRYPKSFWIIGFIGIVIPGIAMSLPFLTNRYESRYLFLILSPLIVVLGSIYLMLMSLSWKFEFREEYFFYRNFLGFKKQYKYSEITRILVCYKKREQFPEKCKVYVGKKVITVDNFAMRGHDFLKEIKKHINADIIVNSHP